MFVGSSNELVLLKVLLLKWGTVTAVVDIYTGIISPSLEN
jgi:hypothetical protein